MKVELITTPMEITDESLKQYLAACSSVVRNSQPKDNERLFQRLLKESYGGRASRVFEYIPCKLNGLESLLDFPENQTFGFCDFENELYYTNARELLNWGLTWEQIIPLVDFMHYRVVKVTAPYFLYGQASTHNQITSVSHSARYTDANLGYWVPSEVNGYWSIRGDQFNIDYTQEERQQMWNYYVENYSPKELQALMKARGVTRREVYARGSDMLAYRVYTLGGYTNNPNSWEHFINQRMRDAHTQKEMRELAGLISDVIYG